MKIHPEKYLENLSHGEISLKGEFMWGSNYTFLTEVEYKDEKIIGVYKPSRGERPLWDFPSASLAGREVAAVIRPAVDHRPAAGGLRSP